MQTRFQQLRELVDARAGVAPDFWTAPGLPPEAEEVEAMAAAGDALSGLNEAAAVAHVGCGVGRLTRHLLVRHPAVVGIEVTPSFLAQGLPNTLAWEGPPAQLPGAPYSGVVLDVSWLAWPAEEFGAVLFAAAASLTAGGWLRLPVNVGPTSEAPPGHLLAPRAHPAALWREWADAAGLAPLALDVGPGWQQTRKRRGHTAAPSLPPAGEAVEEDPELLYAHWLMAADLAAGAGEQARAEACLEAACAVWPTGREGWLQWTFHRLSQGDLKGAAVLTEAWCDARPGDPEAWLRRAEVAEARERPGEARAALAQALGRGPLPTPLQESADALEAALKGP